MTFSIEVKTRTETIEKTREQSLIPAVLYGPEIKSTSVEVDDLMFEKLYKEAGESNLIDLSVAGIKGSSKVLVQAVQHDPVKGNIIHVDFMQINMNKEMYATLPINFVGETPAVKELGGTLIKGLRELNIRCLPKDLVGQIDLDLSVLKTFDDVVHINDLILPQGITVTDNLETVIAKVVPPLTEDQIKAMEESDTQQKVEDIEVEGEKKEEGEEGAEGEKPKSEEAAGDKKEEDAKSDKEGKSDEATKK